MKGELILAGQIKSWMAPRELNFEQKRVSATKLTEHRDWSTIRRSEVVQLGVVSPGHREFFTPYQQ